MPLKQRTQVCTSSPNTAISSSRVVRALASQAPSRPGTSAAEALCQHPDALKRRRDYEEWRKRRRAERQQAAELASLNCLWYEGPQPPNMVHVTSAQEYKALLAQASAEGRLVVAKFFTSECWVCKTLHPKVKKLAQEHPDIVWAKLNGSDPGLSDIFEALGITKVPLFHLVRGGELVSELTASLSPEKLARLRAEVAAHRPASARTPASIRPISTAHVIA